MTTDASETDVELTLEGGGLSFSRQVSESAALKILDLAMGAPGGPAGSLDESVGEYLAGMRPSATSIRSQP